MYKIQYHPKVVRDLKHISTSVQKVLRHAIETKLTTEPDFYGKPLQFSLKGARSMRVGDYRVIFLIRKDIVRIIMVGHRSEVYEEVEKRM